MAAKKEAIQASEIVGNAKKARKKVKKKPAKKSAANSQEAAASSKYPRHSIEKSLRVPKAILEQNAGKECSDKQAAEYVGVGYGGPFQLEISSAAKYGLLDRPSTGHIKPTELAKQILRPQKPEDELRGLQTAVMQAPVISDVYNHYRGENLPDKQFLDNALADTFHIPKEKIEEFSQIFLSTLESAKLLERNGEKYRLIDVSNEGESSPVNDSRIKQLGKAVSVSSGDTCFVMMPFAPPIGDHYSKIYEPAIRKAGLTPVRADDDIFGTGKIMDQIWTGLNHAKVLVAELTGRNPNVFYELGLAHALDKPVVLVSRNQDDVPFDLQHIRVIYYNVDDPFLGNKLIDKVAENILSAIQNPKDAVFKRAVESIT